MKRLLRYVPEVTRLTIYYDAELLEIIKCNKSPLNYIDIIKELNVFRFQTAKDRNDTASITPVVVHRV